MNNIIKIKDLERARERKKVEARKINVVNFMKSPYQLHDIFTIQKYCVLQELNIEHTQCVARGNLLGLNKR